MQVKMWYLENDQLCSGKPINATDSYQALQERERERERERDTHAHAHAHTHTQTVKNAFQIYLLDLKEPFIVDAVYLIGCSPQALGLSITDTHLSS